MQLFWQLSRLSLLAALLPQAAEPASPLPLHLLDVSTGARCSDGTPSGYYADFSAVNPDALVIFLQGGGACFSYASCEARLNSTLGSSKFFPPTFSDSSNVLSDDPSTNPGLANATKVFVPYCSGDVHSGTRTAIVSPAMPFFFAGALTVRAVVADLLAKEPALATAATVVLSGASAGGIGAFMHAQPLRAAFAGAKRFVVAPQAGWFFPQVVNYSAFQAGELGPPYAGENPEISFLWGTQLDADCVAAFNASYCSSVPNAAPFYMKGLDFHVSEYEIDSNQVFAQLGAPTSPRPDAFLAYFRARMLASLQPLADAAEGGRGALWAAACLAHTEGLDLAGKTRVGGVTYGESFSSWLQRDADAPRLAEDLCAGEACNPSCPPASAARARRGRFAEGGWEEEPVWS